MKGAARPRHLTEVLLCPLEPCAAYRYGSPFPMLQTGIELMLIGMGVVFAFLLLLVGCVHVLGQFFARFGHWFPEPTPVGLPKRAIAPARPNSPLVAVALAAAYRARSGQPR